MNKTTCTYSALIVVLIAAAALSLRLYFRQRSERDMLDVRKFPYTVGEWKGKDIEITQKEYAILETRNLFLREFENAAKEKIYLFIIYSETNRSVFHPPEVCMIGSGMSITDKKTEKIDLREKSFFTNKLYASKGNFKEIFLYAYKSGNLYTDNFYLQQIHFILNQLFGKDKSGATIRVSMSLTKSEEYATATLSQFLKDTIAILEKLQ